MSATSKSTRRPLAARLALAIAAPLVLLGLAEAVVRLGGLAPERPLVVLEAASEPGFVRVRALGISTDTPQVTPPFQRERNPGTYRIALLGESAAAGFPHHETSTPARWLEALLDGRCGGQRVEVIDCAIAGIAGDWLEEVARTVVPLDIDAVLVYAGNNEFLSAFVDRRAALDRPTFAGSLLRNSAVARFLAERVLGPPALQATRSPLDTRGHIEEALGPLRASIEDHFERNLVAIGEIAAAHGAPVLYCRPVAARREYPPLSSQVRAGVSAQERDILRVQLDRAAEALAVRDVAAARAALEAARAIDAELGLVVFRAAALAELEGDERTARECYDHALDLDDRPSRVNGKLAARIAAAARARGAPYCDSDAWFARQGADGIVPPQLVVDHVHLSIEGHYRLAEYFTEILRERSLPRAAAEWGAPPIADFAAGVKALSIQLGAAIVNQVQLGFASLLTAYEQPANRIEHLGRARRQFEAVLAAQENQPRALCGLGLLAAAEGDRQGAIERFDAAYRVSPVIVAEVRVATERFTIFQSILTTAGVRFDDSGRLVAVE